MKKNALAFASERFLFVMALISAVVLLLSGAALVTTQYRVRLLFVEIERANDVARRLSDDSSQLALDLSKAALPAAVPPPADSKASPSPGLPACSDTGAEPSPRF